MAEPDAQRGPRVVRIPVARPLLSALAVMSFGAALLVGGGAERPSAVATRPTVPPALAEQPSQGPPPDWDVTPRDLVVGDRTSSVLAVDQVISDPLRVSSLAAALQPVVTQQLSARPDGATSVPEVLWSAYRSAVDSAPSSCRLPVELLAAIGQVESGSLAGRGLDRRHRAVPAVLGPVLDGRGFAAISDTDDGRFDGDTTWDRAVGPMQFIPSTWQRWGRDGNSDGTRDPQNVEDAAFSAAAYLCADSRDLSSAAGLRSAILSYNHSEAYLADVLALMRTVTPGGSIPRSVFTVPSAPRPVVGPVVRPAVGPPSRPPVRAVARPRSDSTSTRPTTSSTSPRPATGTATTSATTPPTTTTTGPSATSSTSTTASPTSTTPPPTSTTSTTATTSTTSSSTSTGTATSSSTTGTSTTSSTSTPPAPTSSTSCPTPSSSATTTTAGSTPDPATTTSPTSPAATTTSPTSPATTTSPGAGTTSGEPSPDPCTSSATEDPTSESHGVAWFGSSTWPTQGTISNLTVLVLMLASVSFTFTRVPSWASPVAFARTAGSST